MSTMILGITAAVVVLLYTIWAFLDHPTPKIKIPDPGTFKNKRKEKKLLQVLLKDMKKNPGNWVQNGFCPQMLSAPILVNDKKNMGVIYGDKETSLSIHFNMKDVTYFDHQDTDAIVTTISGKHVTKFIKRAIYLLDHRGKELEYFTERLEERL